MRIFGRGKGRFRFLRWAMVVAEDFEDVKAEFEGEDADRGLGVEPGGGEDDDRFDDLPDFFTIGVGLVRLSDADVRCIQKIQLCRKYVR
jgi:hypothetical protein